MRQVEPRRESLNTLTARAVVYDNLDLPLNDLIVVRALHSGEGPLLDPLCPATSTDERAFVPKAAVTTEFVGWRSDERTSLHCQ